MSNVAKPCVHCGGWHWGHKCPTVESLQAILDEPDEKPAAAPVERPLGFSDGECRDAARLAALKPVEPAPAVVPLSVREYANIVAPGTYQAEPPASPPAAEPLHDSVCGDAGCSCLGRARAEVASLRVELEWHKAALGTEKDQRLAESVSLEVACKERDAALARAEQAEAALTEKQRAAFMAGTNARWEGEDRWRFDDDGCETCRTDSDAAYTAWLGQQATENKA